MAETPAHFNRNYLNNFIFILYFYFKEFNLSACPRHIHDYLF